MELKKNNAPALIRRSIYYLHSARLPVLLALVFVLQNQAFIFWLQIIPHLYLVRCSLVTFALGALLYGPAVFLSQRSRYWYLMPISAIISLIFISEFIYFSFFKGFMQASALEYADQSLAVMGSIAALLSPKLILFAINFFIVILAAVLAYSGRCRPIILIKKEKLAAAFAILIVVTGGYGWLLHAEKRDWGHLKKLYSQLYDLNMLVGKVGIVNYFIEDAVKLALRRREITLEDRIFAAEWVRNRPAAPEPKRDFGIAKGRNFIMIQVESLEGAVIGAKIGGLEVAPNLNALAKDGLYFTNYFTQVAEGNTADTEFVILNSLYPLPDGVAFLDFAQNRYLALPELLAKNGYHAYAFHGDVPTFWNRSNIYPGLGYEAWFARKDFTIPRAVGYQDLGDEDFFRQSIPKLASLKQPFMATLLTLSSHHPFTLPSDLQTLPIPPNSGLDEIQQQYVESIHYVDRAIGEFILQLKQARLYDNSLIVILGDHGSYANIGKVFKTGPDAPADFSDRRVPLIIIAPKTRLKGTVKAVASHLDFYPTVARLLGIEPPPSALGQDALSTDTPLVVRRQAGSGDIGAILSSRVIYLAATDGVFENGKCLEASERKPLPIAECRSIYNEQTSLIRVSDTIVRGDLIPALNSSLAQVPLSSEGE